MNVSIPQDTAKELLAIINNELNVLELRNYKGSYVKGHQRPTSNDTAKVMELRRYKNDLEDALR